VQTLTWLLTILSLFGVVLNIHHNRKCFYIWAFTNASWAVVDFSAGLHAQGVLFVIYTILALWGIIKWKGETRWKGVMT